MKGYKKSLSKMEDQAFFWSVSANLGQKWTENHNFSNRQKKFASHQKFNLTMISHQKMSIFYHTLRKSGPIDISGIFEQGENPAVQSAPNSNKHCLTSKIQSDNDFPPKNIYILSYFEEKWANWHLGHFWRRKFFWGPKGGPFYTKKIFCFRFPSNFMWWILGS